MTRQKKNHRPHRQGHRAAGGQAVARRPVAAEPPRVTATSAADLLGLVPYLLGFHPAESLVVLLIRDRRVLLTARVDLPPVAHASGVVARFGHLADQHDASGVVLFAFSADLDPARALLELLVTGLHPFGLLDAVLVGENRWWSLMCTGACCPADGTAYDVQAHRMAAEAVYAGLSAAAERSSIEAMVAGPPAADFDRLAEAARQAQADVKLLTRAERSDEMAQSVRAFVSEPRPLSEPECARLAVLAAQVSVRDVAWALISREAADAHVDLWSQVVSTAVAPWQAAPLCLLGMAAWVCGNGALQNCCSERVHEVSPAYTMASLLDEISDRALPPSFWDRMAPDMREVTGALAPRGG
jgi:hypothetical protein